MKVSFLELIKICAIFLDAPLMTMQPYSRSFVFCCSITCQHCAIFLCLSLSLSLFSLSLCLSPSLSLSLFLSLSLSLSFSLCLISRATHLPLRLVYMLKYSPSTSEYRLIYSECHMARGAHGLPSLHICRAAGETNIDQVNRAHQGPYHELNISNIHKREVNLKSAKRKLLVDVRALRALATAVFVQWSVAAELIWSIFFHLHSSTRRYCKVTNFRPEPIFVLLTWNWFVRTIFRTFEGLNTKWRWK